MDYKLKLQQLVDYPRCRIYRQFIKKLSEDTNIRLNGDSYLFYFIMLCALVNFQTSYCKVAVNNELIFPGEWVTSINELEKYFRMKSRKNIVAVLNNMKSMGCLDYFFIGTSQLIRYKICNWSKFNTVVEANAPCTKEHGFFFFPFKYLKKFIGHGKVSEMDVILDLWLNTIYNDGRVSGSDVGQVVYYRNGTGSPLIGYDELGKRWGISKSTAGRILKKLEAKDEACDLFKAAQALR